MLNEIITLDKQYYMNTFGERTPLCFTRGDGISLYTTDGEKFTDFFAGIAVNCLGYNHPALTSALQEQVANLLHTSSVYYVENQAKLAQMLAENSCADKIFFASTGAEANEGAIKLVRKYFYNRRGELCSPANENNPQCTAGEHSSPLQNRPQKLEIVTLNNSFHGRTLATLAATGQPKYQQPYAPLLEKFVHVEANDCAALAAAVNENTTAIMLELVQGESGVRPLEQEFVKFARKLCDERGIFLIFDEIQTGIGRCGTLFAYERFGVEPDVFTLAKGLGGGVPVAAICAKAELASAFSPGDHGTTFGGNPLSTRAGITVLDQLINNGVLKNVAEIGEYLGEKLTELAANCGKIAEIRGLGLMRAVEFKEEIARDVLAKLIEKRYLIGVIGTKVLRLTPPLIVTKEDVDKFIATLKEILI